MTRKPFRSPARTLALAAALCLALLSGGCAAQDGASGSSDAPGAGAQEHEPLSVCNLNNLFSDDFIEVFQEKHPEISFEASAYRGANGSGLALTSLETGDVPDIYISTYPFSPEAQREHLIDLSGYAFVNNYTTTMLNSLDNEGGIYLLPSCFQMTGISYNKTLMAEHGWEVPNSFEELLALAPAIEAEGLDVMRCMFNLDGYPFNYFFNILNTEYFHTAEGSQWKTDFTNGKAKAAGNAELLAGAEYFERWVDAGLIADREGNPQDAFMNGECVFFLSLGLSVYENTTEDGRTYEFDVMPWLSDDGTTNTLTTTTSRYFGLSKRLLEPGNEQKLADALALMEFVSTLEGQEALVAKTAEPSLYTAPLAGASVPADSPFAELEYLVKEGHTVQLVYVGWEDLIIPIAQDVRRLVSGEIGAEELLEAFDATYAEVASGDDGSIAVLEEDLSWEDTMRLCAVALGRAADADAALVTHGGYNEAREINDRGVAWHAYAGGVGIEEINMFRTKCYSINVLEMTGAEIKALAEGGFDLCGTGNVFPYYLVTKGDVELEDNTVYRLAVGTEELTEDMRAQAVEVQNIASQQVVIDYVSELGTFGAEDIVWE